MSLATESLDFIPRTHPAARPSPPIPRFPEPWPPLTASADLDPPPSPDTRATILDAVSTAPPAALHPSIPPYRPAPAAATSALLATLPDPLTDPAAAPPPPLAAIDKARYEALDPPAPDAPSAALRDAYARAAAAHAYLRWRAEHLGLLAAHGKDVWISGGVAVEAELGALERELGVAREEKERVEGERRAAAEAVVGEVKGLEDGWRRGVRGTVGALVAGEEVRERVAGERRARVERAWVG